jgi:DnaJ homologue, subfamily C, member 28, conserved domain
MTDRKPAEMTFTSWIDKQIAEAAERGAFDNLPGAGKPIPDHGNEDAAQGWLREYLRKEGVSAEALLPPPLRLRKAIDRLTQAVPEMASESDVRDAVAELNHEIREWRRIPLGPPVFVPLVDGEAMVSRWRGARSRHDGDGVRR